MNKEYSAGAVIFRKQANIVLFLIIYSARNKIWGFPKGHVEPNETEKQAALREITEETGLQDIKIEKGFRQEDVYIAKSNRGEFKGQNIEKHSIYFLVKTKQKDVLVDNDEINDYKWLKFNEALALLDFDSAKNVLRKAGEFLNDQRFKRMLERVGKYKCPKCNGPIKEITPFPSKYPYILMEDIAMISDKACLWGSKGKRYKYQCYECDTVFIVKKGKLVSFCEDEEYEEESNVDDKDEIGNIDDDIETLEMLDFFDDGLL